MRISLLVPFYSFFCFLSICFPTADVYLEPWLEVFQANSLCAFFLLMCDFISPNSEKRSNFFAQMTVLDKKSQAGKVGGLSWFRVSRNTCGKQIGVQLTFSRLESLDSSLSVSNYRTADSDCYRYFRGGWNLLSIQDRAILYEAVGMLISIPCWHYQGDYN
jgi:hypothetical protein